VDVNAALVTKEQSPFRKLYVLNLREPQEVAPLLGYLAGVARPPVESDRPPPPGSALWVPWNWISPFPSTPRRCTRNLISGWGRACAPDARRAGATCGAHLTSVGTRRLGGPQVGLSRDAMLERVPEGTERARRPLSVQHRGPRRSTHPERQPLTTAVPRVTTTRRRVRLRT
jgi:hypothetical protein